MPRFALRLLAGVSGWPVYPTPVFQITLHATPQITLFCCPCSPIALHRWWHFRSTNRAPFGTCRRIRMDNLEFTQVAQVELNA